MIDISRLENVRYKGSNLIAACPACRDAGRDKQGNHLIVFPGEDGTHDNGIFGCVANEGDGAHRSEIFSFIGVKENPSDMEKATWVGRTRKAVQRAQKRLAKKREEKCIKNYLEKTQGARLAPYLTKFWRIELLDRSPMNFDSPDDLRHDFIMSLYHPDDILWMGDTIYDSGSPRHRSNFKTCREWLTLTELPHHIASGTFNADCYSRIAPNVKTSPYILIECDEIIGFKPEEPEDRELNKQLSHALICYAENELGLTLRAVIDTGGKSLHAFFDRPQARAVEALNKLATGLRIDKGPIDQGHYPLRMPGCPYKETNRTARLLYLNPIHK